MPGLIGRRSAESGAEGTSAATYCLICVPRYPGTVGKPLLVGTNAGLMLRSVLDVAVPVLVVFTMTIVGLQLT